MSQLKAVLGDSLKGKDGSVDVDTLAENDIIGVYFSAHWCPPCRMFTPMLAESYNTMRGNGKKFQVVFVSSDRSEADFEEYYSDMPWLAVPFGSDIKKKLGEDYQVTGIPCLVLLDKDGKLVTKDGRQKVSDDPDGANFPWK